MGEGHELDGCNDDVWDRVGFVDDGDGICESVERGDFDTG
jgi:hypothetical protein